MPRGNNSAAQMKIIDKKYYSNYSLSSIKNVFVYDDNMMLCKTEMKINPVGKSVDDAIVNLAKKDKKNIVCTLDREMRWNLGRVILISRGKKLILTR